MGYNDDVVSAWGRESVWPKVDNIYMVESDHYKRDPKENKI